MKTFIAIKRATLSLGTIALVSISLATHAQSVALQGQLMVRPLTPQEVKDYSLTGTQTASGLNTVAIGQPAYIDALINRNVPSSNTVEVTWSLTAPAGSAAVLTNSPFGSNVPPYKMADRLTTKVGGRTMLRPDIAGQYTITASINWVPQRHQHPRANQPDAKAHSGNVYGRERLCTLPQWRLARR